MRSLLFVLAIALAGCMTQHPVAKPAALLGSGDQVTTAQNNATAAQVDDLFREADALV